MESLSPRFFGSPPLKTQKPVISKPTSLLAKPIPSLISTTQSSNFRHIHFPCATPHSNPPQIHPFLLQFSPFFQTSAKTHLPFLLSGLVTTTAPPSFASESLVSSNEQVSDKINLEAILVSIDNFFNRYPFFVAGCTFIWLVVVPLIQFYFSKCKFVYAIDAFRKLREDPNAQLLDIRNEKNVKSLRSPNLKMLNKNVVQVQFSEDDEDGFVKKVLGNFKDPANTVVCILDNLDGNSMKVAELLYKNGFKEAYAIKGGVGGKKGWLEIQETLLPPSVHIITSKKKIETSKELGTNGVIQNKEDSNVISTSPPAGESQGMDNGSVTMSTDSIPHKKIGARSSSPYPNYPDLKPPSSPTPSKP